MFERHQKLFVIDIQESVNAILEYVSHINFEQFTQDRKTYSAVIREFEIIGEATKHLSSDITLRFNQVNWRDLKDFRNLLIHEYFGVDHEIVWSVIKEDLPVLKQVIDQIVLNFD